MSVGIKAVSVYKPNNYIDNVDEARKLEASGKEYKKYIKQTNSFFPGSLKKLN